MLSTAQRFGSAPARDAFGRRLTLTHAATAAVIAIAAFGSYLTIDRAVQVARAASSAMMLTEHERMLSERVAGLAARYAAGDGSARAELRTATTAFERVHWHLVAGDSIGVRAAIADPPLKTIDSSGPAELDIAATQFIARARRIAGSTSGAPALAASRAQSAGSAQAAGLGAALETAETLRRNRADLQLAQLRLAAAALCTLVFAALLTGAVAVFRPMARRIVALGREVEALRQITTIDPLTGTLNRRGFHARGAVEVHKARRYQRPLSLLMIDADGLTAIEDAYGPGGSETVLRALTSSFFSGTRVCDLVGRVEGEQFAILLPETTREGAKLLAERLREQIGSLTVPIRDKAVSCTVSIGVAAAEKDAAFLWPTFKRADEALYEAKMRGRNQVVVA